MADIIRNIQGLGLPNKIIQPYMSSYRDSRTQTIYRQLDFPSGNNWVPVAIGGNDINSVQAGTNITIDNTDPSNPIVNADISGAISVAYEEQDKPALLAVSDGDKATSSLITQEPVDGGYIEVYVDGIKFSVGRGVKTEPFYFSGDGGVTAKGFSTSDPTGKVVVGDELYVNPSILGEGLDISDCITITYNI